MNGLGFMIGWLKTLQDPVMRCSEANRMKDEREKKKERQIAAASASELKVHLTHNICFD